MNIKLTFFFCFILQTVLSFAGDRKEIKIPLFGVQEVFPVDLDHDNDLDFIVLHRDTEDLQYSSMRFISIFFQNRGIYQSTADIRYRVGDRDILVDWGDMDGDGLMEFYIIRPDGIVSWSPQRPDSLIPVLLSPSIFSGADADRLVHWPFLWDIDADSTSEIILNQKQGLHVYAKDSLNHYRLSAILQVNFEHRLIREESLILQTCLPQMLLKEMNHDNRPDIVFFSDDRLAVFYTQTRPGMIYTQPILPDYIFRFSMKDSHLSMLEALAPADMSIELDDLNRDGCSDIVFSRASKAGFTKTLSQVQLYYCTEGKFQPLPDHVLMAENFYGDHVIADFNSDGRKDIALLQFPIGLVGAAKFLITRRIKYGFDIYLQKPDGHFKDEPDHRIRFSRHSNISHVLRPEYSEFTDWDGNGRLDLLVNVDHQQIIGFIQKNTGGFSKHPDVKIKIPVSPQHWTGDLNNDRQADIVLWYEDPGEIRCLMSRADP
ncbi:VCBS repeat-containing protein [bacterium]|nr:VCBS repeat-containing protein [bacterium]